VVISVSRVELVILTHILTLIKRLFKLLGCSLARALGRVRTHHHIIGLLAFEALEAHAVILLEERVVQAPLGAIDGDLDICFHALRYTFLVETIILKLVLVLPAFLLHWLFAWLPSILI